eukprot:11864071-Heterocapsa_arctica.AAC.1
MAPHDRPLAAVVLPVHLPHGRPRHSQEAFVMPGIFGVPSQRAPSPVVYPGIDESNEGLFHYLHHDVLAVLCWREA